MHIGAYLNSKSFKHIIYEIWEKEKELENRKETTGLFSPLPPFRPTAAHPPLSFSSSTSTPRWASASAQPQARSLPPPFLLRTGPAGPACRACCLPLLPLYLADTRDSPVITVAYLQTPQIPCHPPPPRPRCHGHPSHLLAERIKLRALANLPSPTWLPHPALSPLFSPRSLSRCHHGLPARAPLPRCHRIRMRAPSRVHCAKLT